jgi:hypothetical protein
VPSEQATQANIDQDENRKELTNGSARSAFVPEEKKEKGQRNNIPVHRIDQLLYTSDEQQKEPAPAFLPPEFIRWMRKTKQKAQFLPRKSEEKRIRKLPNEKKDTKTPLHIMTCIAMVLGEKNSHVVQRRLR